MEKVGWVSDQRYLEHGDGINHPECPERLSAIIARINESGLAKDLELIKPELATNDMIKKVHDEKYIDFIKETSKNKFMYLDSDTYVQEVSYKTALLACGGVVTAARRIFEDDLKRIFCAIRPPGHHAERDRAMGFCLFNNIAVLARQLQDHHSIQRVLILDWDVHHGNGTQHIFYSDDSVYFISIHQSPFYPGTGLNSERGENKGLNYTLNFPLSSGQTDSDYFRLFETQIEKEIIKFKPEIILISAGFDAHKDDPLAGMKLTADGFGRLTRIVSDWANEFAQGRIISLLEGSATICSVRILSVSFKFTSSVDL